METLRICSRCTNERALNEFSKDERCADGRSFVCVECRRAADRARYAANAGAIREKERRRNRATRNAARREWLKNNPEQAEKIRKSKLVGNMTDDQRRHYALKEKERSIRRQGIVGITAEEYEMRVLEQGGRCAICLNPPTSKGLAMDHDHSSGAFRGLLCSSCNAGIGMFKDDPSVMKKAIEYLARHGRI